MNSSPTGLPEILLVDDPRGRLEEVRRRLVAEGLAVRFARNGQEALKALREGSFQVVALPETLDETSGAALLRRAARSTDHMTGVLLVDPGAPLAPSDLPQDTIVLPIDKTAEIASTLAGAARLRAHSPALDRIVGESEGILQIKQVLRQVGPTKLNVLVTGESGTGKELVALAIHELSPRRNAPFVAVNAGALPEGVLESELFGHEKGSFTGAHAMRAGRFEIADKGTLFLDEIGEMPPQIQVKLLRVLEESRFLRVGGARNIEVDVRVVAATNQDLEEAVEAGRFRHVLYFRLNVFHIEIPPLRKRRGDIPLLVGQFVRRIAIENDLRPIQFDKEAMEILIEHHWPGNIRELRNVIEKLAVLYAGREVKAQHLEEAFGRRLRRGANLPVVLEEVEAPADREMIYRTLLALRAEIAELKALVLRSTGSGRRPAAVGDEAVRIDPLAGETDATSPIGRPLEPLDAVVSESGEAPPSREGPFALADLERDAIIRALRRTGGNRRRAAALLGMGERTLYRKLREYGLVTRSGDPANEPV